MQWTIAKPKKWHTSTETKALLNVSGCDLAHLRQAGKLRYAKHGNAYFYDLVSIAKLGQLVNKKAGPPSSKGQCSL